MKAFVPKPNHYPDRRFTSVHYIDKQLQFRLLITPKFGGEEDQNRVDLKSSDHHRKT